jgi:hypothetical protein
MKMINYQVFSNRVVVYINNGQSLTIYFNENSGRAYFRYKIGTISKVKHPAIFIGTDYYGNEYFIHNHYQVGSACLVTRSEFDKGQAIHLYKEKCSNTPRTIIEKAFAHGMRAEKYHFITYNCQTLVNDACSNTRKSEDVDKWAGGIFAASLALLLIGAASSSK